MKVVENHTTFRDNVRISLLTELDIENKFDKSFTDVKLGSIHKLAFNLEVSIYNYSIKEARQLKVHKMEQSIFCGVVYQSSPKYLHESSES